MVHFVHIYVIEPHPRSPDLSPYSAAVSEASYSTKYQPRTYSERVAAARDMKEFLASSQLLFVDEMPPEPRNNPLWCTFGPAPNSVYLINQMGKVVFADEWLNLNDVEDEIDTLLNK